ncbi:MAG: AsnC family transcriptional regulator, partial [Rhizobium sp.]|nr:AsnC family transcriptional regulator [Rhizobium sp.]
MDDLDRDILSALRHNARIPASSLAAMTGASRAT